MTSFMDDPYKIHRYTKMHTKV